MNYSLGNATVSLSSELYKIKESNIRADREENRDILLNMS